MSPAATAVADIIDAAFTIGPVILAALFIIYAIKGYRGR